MPRWLPEDCLPTCLECPAPLCAAQERLPACCCLGRQMLSYEPSKTAHSAAMLLGLPGPTHADQSVVCACAGLLQQGVLDARHTE